MRIAALFIALAALVAGFMAPDKARAQERYVFDKAHTVIAFSVGRFGYTNMWGRFNKYDGTFLFDENNIANSRITATIQTASIDTGHGRRDGHLRSPGFFNVKEFPVMKFTSTKVEKTGAKTGRITGNLTLLGVTKPVTLEVTFNRKALHPRIKKVFAGFTATGELDRTAFGMKFLAPRISPKARLTIELLGIKQ